jgi:hypothetical protein
MTFIPNKICNADVVGNVRIISIGLERSGSTMIWQFLADLYPDGIAKTHQFIDRDVPVIATTRDPRDCVVSSIRSYEPGTKRVEPVKFASYREIFIEKSVRALLRYVERKRRLLVLPYEAFIQRPNMIFDGFERFLGMHIHPDRREALLSKFSMEANRKRATRFKSFHSFDPKTHIHGDHVHEGKIGSWLDFVRPEDRVAINRIIAPEMSMLQKL